MSTAGRSNQCPFEHSPVLLTRVNRVKLWQWPKFHSIFKLFDGRPIFLILRLNTDLPKAFEQGKDRHQGECDEDEAPGVVAVHEVAD